MSQIFILIPPSEGKAPNGRHEPLEKLNPNVQVMYERLMAYKDDFSRLYGVKKSALEEAVAANKSVLTSPTLPAIERYNGVVYQGIGYSTLSDKGKEFFNEHVRIISALFGLLRPGDLIPDYKLKIDKLDAAKHWRPIITKELKGSTIIDLLPQAHQKSVEYGQGVTVEFIVRNGGKVVAAGHQSKITKGKFIRFLCENGITEPKDFVGFKEDGFRFNGCNFIKG